MRNKKYVSPCVNVVTMEGVCQMLDGSNPTGTASFGKTVHEEREITNITLELGSEGDDPSVRGTQGSSSDGWTVVKE